MAEKISTSDLSASSMPGTPIKCASAQTDEPPDGGFRAWATVAGGFMIYFAGLGYFNAYGCGATLDHPIFSSTVSFALKVSTKTTMFANS